MADFLDTLATVFAFFSAAMMFPFMRQLLRKLLLVTARILGLLTLQWLRLLQGIIQILEEG